MHTNAEIAYHKWLYQKGMIDYRLYRMKPYPGQKKKIVECMLPNFGYWNVWCEQLYPHKSGSWTTNITKFLNDLFFREHPVYLNITSDDRREFVEFFRKNPPCKDSGMWTLFHIRDEFIIAYRRTILYDEDWRWKREPIESAILNFR